jgi:hypothetical protein
MLCWEANLSKWVLLKLCRAELHSHGRYMRVRTSIPILSNTSLRCPVYIAKFFRL